MRRLVGGAIALGVLAIAVAALTVSAARSLPDWYEVPAEEVEEPGRQGLFGALATGFGSLPPSLLMRLAELAQDGRAELDAEEVNGLLMAWAATDADGRRVLNAAEELRTHLADGRIEVGGRFELAKIDAEGLDTDGRRLLELARRYLFFATGRPVYVGIDATATAHDNRVFVGDDFRVRVGSLSVPRFLVYRALRLDERTLAAGFEVDMDRYRIAEGRVEGDRVVLIAAAER